MSQKDHSRIPMLRTKSYFIFMLTKNRVRMRFYKVVPVDAGILFLLLSISPFVIGLADAQVPTEIAHQGSITVNGTSVTDASASLSFALYTTASGGSALWTETQTGVPVSDGRFVVQLGSVSSLSAVAFDVPYWLETTYAGNTLTPRFQLASSPYARAAKNAESAPWSGVSGKLSTLDQKSQLLNDTLCNPWVIPFLKYGTLFSQQIYFTNTANTGYYLNVSAIDQSGTVYDLGRVANVLAYSITNIRSDINTALTAAGFGGTGEIAIGIRAHADFATGVVSASFTAQDDFRAPVDIICVQ